MLGEFFEVGKYGSIDVLPEEQFNISMTLLDWRLLS